MNWESFKFAAIGAVQTLAQGWSYKTLIAAMLAMILHKHAILFYRMGCNILSASKR